jgi:integrase
MGTLRERASGSWELTVATGLDPATGKYGRVVRTVKANGKREAKAALARLEVEVRAGRVVAKDPTLGELLERWMTHAATLGRSDSTLYHYQRYIDREIKRVLGATRLSKLTAYDIDRFYSGLTARGLAPATVRQIHAIIRASLNQGEKWGLVGRNVAKLASPPSQPQREQQPPTVDEVHRLLDAATLIDPLFGLYVRVVVATGARRAEVCGLRWTDVDLDAGTVSISRSYMVLPNGVRGDRPTKTRSARVVTLDAETVDALRTGWEVALRNATLAGVAESVRREGYVFSFELDGSLGFRPDVVDARWRRTRIMAKVPTTIRIHDLRHWQATQLLDAGVPVPTVAARLGHADGTTTMKVYAHRTKRADEQAAAVVADVLKRKPS